MELDNVFRSNISRILVLWTIYTILKMNEKGSDDLKYRISKSPSVVQVKCRQASSMVSQLCDT